MSAVAGLFQVGSWYGSKTIPCMALVRSPGDAGPWTRSAITADSSEAKAFAVNPGAPNVLYVGGYVGLGDGQWTSHYACLFKSTNTGATWSRLASSIFTNDRECVYGLCIDPANSSQILAVTDKGAYRSTNGGTSWTIPSQAFSGTSVIADPTVSGRFFAGAKDGVYESTDAGVNWTRISKGLPGRSVTSLAYDAASQRLVAGTNGNGIYRLGFVPTWVAGDDGVPQAAMLQQNYPNPFNGLTEIRYFLPDRMEVRLQVYDLLGKQVAVLADGPKEPGYHFATLDAGTLASGVYLYRLTAGKTVLTRRMVLVR